MTASPPTGPAQPPRVGQQFGQYRIDGVVGVGGMGMVFEARDQNLGRAVALKVVLGHYAESSTFLERFQREATVLARLDSPHVVTIYDHGEQQGLPFIVTQYAAGGDLGRLLRGRGAMPPGLATQLCAQVADALVAAHAVGVVHRDVKPANVLLRDDRLERLHVYLCDFGVALTEASGLTTPGSIAGTWNYMAPERVEGQHGSPASDIYAVGCLFWECLTCQPPYQGSDVEVALEHVNAPVPQLSGSGEFAAHANVVLQRALAKDPAARYPDAAALRDDLRRLGGLFSAAESTPLPGAAAARPGRRRRTALLIGGLVVAVVAVVAVTVGLLSRGGDGPSPAPSPPTSTGVTAPGQPTPVNRGVVYGDLNGDGFGDVFFTDTERGYLRTSDGSSLASTTQRRSGATTPTVEGDVDGDGQIDLVTVTGTAPVLSASVVTPTNSSPSNNITVAADQSSEGTDNRVALGDVDGDGKDDLIVDVTAKAGEELWVALSQGDGRFGAAQRWWTGTDLTSSLAGLVVGDLNGDGRDDVGVVTVDTSAASYDSDDVAVVQMLAAGDTRFTTLGKELHIPRDVDDVYLSADFMALADVTGDGRPELVMAGSYTVDSLVYTWTGTAFTDPKIWSNESEPDYDDELTQVGLADVDGDGKADLVLSGEKRIEVRRSTGTSFRSDHAFDSGPIASSYPHITGVATAIQPTY